MMSSLIPPETIHNFINVAMSQNAAKLEQLLEILRSSEGEGASVAELCAAIIARKNKENAMRFLRTAYSERVVLVPQCLRSAANCRAKERAGEYFCAQCGSCKIAAIVQRAADLGYLGVRILKGGSVVARLLDEVKPKAVIGIACKFEGVLGVLACERAGVAALSVPLLKDGCCDTDVDLDEVMDALEVSVS